MNVSFNREDIIWAAGLFEGEGCVTSYKKWKTVHLCLQMTDEDSVRRFHQCVGGFGQVTVIPPPKDKPHHKMKWNWHLGAFNESQAVVVALYPWLGERRQARIREVLRTRRESDAGGRTTRNGLCVEDGCENQRYARGLCLQHYGKAKRAGLLGDIQTRQGVVSKASPQKCSVEGCKGGAAVRGMCETHYGKFRHRYKAADAPPSRTGRPLRECSVEGCGRPHKGKGFCSYHYIRQTVKEATEAKGGTYRPRVSQIGRCEALKLEVALAVKDGGMTLKSAASLFGVSEYSVWSNVRPR